MLKIEGGYILISRQIFESSIWTNNPHVLKLFIYLLGMARHKYIPKKYPNFEINRVELVTSLSIISDDNEYMEKGKLRKWSRQKVSRMLQTLIDGEYITLLADTYGTHIKIVNYDTYQNPSLYRTDSNGTGLDSIWNGSGQQLGTNNNDNNDNNEKKEIPTHNIQKLFIKSFGRNPNIPEQTETAKMIERFNYELMDKAFKDGVYDGCKKVKTLISRINEKGIYIPFPKNEDNQSNAINIIGKGKREITRI